MPEKEVLALEPDASATVPLRPPQVVVSVLAFERKTAREGVELLVDGKRMETPATITRDPGATVEVDVIDRRWRRATRHCVVPHVETFDCGVDLKRVRRRRQPTATPAGDSEGVRKGDFLIPDPNTKELKRED